MNRTVPSGRICRSLAVLSCLVLASAIACNSNSDESDEQSIDSPAARALKKLGAHLSLRKQGGTFVDLYHVKEVPTALKHVVELPDVRVVVLSSTLVTDDDLGQIKALESLEELSLNNTPITDAGVEQLAGLKKLKRLNLRETKIGDASIEHLGNLAKLEQLFLSDTDISPAGLTRLKELLPETSITCEKTPDTVEQDQDENY